MIDIKNNKLITLRYFNIDNMNRIFDIIILIK